MMRIKAVQFGLGKIGKEISRLLLNRDRFELVGAVEKDREKVGLDPAELLDLNYSSGIAVTDSPREVLAEKPELAFHSTASRVSEVHEQLKQILEAGTNVISTSEELAYPYLQAQERADELDGIAKKNGVTIFGTGVNPGFVMDLLPLTFSGIARTLESLTVKRVQNASVRRKALQAKIGVGLSEEDFDKKVRQKGGHVGLIESLSLVSTGLGWKLDEIEERTDPVIGDEIVETEHFKVQPGESLGIDQTAIGIMAGEEKVRLNLQIFAGASDPVDEVTLRGVPEARIKVPGGIHGDIATPAIAVNSSERVLQESPGLITLLDIYPYIYNFE